MYNLDSFASHNCTEFENPSSSRESNGNPKKAPLMISDTPLTQFLCHVIASIFSVCVRVRSRAEEQEVAVWNMEILLSMPSLLLSVAVLPVSGCQTSSEGTKPGSETKPWMFIFCDLYTVDITVTFWPVLCRSPALYTKAGQRCNFHWMWRRLVPLTFIVSAYQTNDIPFSHTSALGFVLICMSANVSTLIR